MTNKLCEVSLQYFIARFRSLFQLRHFLFIGGTILCTNDQLFPSWRFTDSIDSLITLKLYFEAMTFDAIPVTSYAKQ